MHHFFRRKQKKTNRTHDCGAQKVIIKANVIMSEESTTDVDQSCLTIQAMIKQEESGYTIPDYLENVPETKNDLDQPVDSDIRFLIAQWTLQLAEICEYSSETSWIAMSCLDRFLATTDGCPVLLDCLKFQNAALAALYIAIKMNEMEVLGPANMAQLSRGQQTEGDIEEMELRILNALEWRVHPPTALSFVHMFLQLIPKFDPQYRPNILEMAEFQIQHSILDYDLCRVKASRIAFATTLNAVAILYQDKELCTSFQKAIAAVTDIDGGSLRGLQQELFLSIPDDKLDEWSEEPRPSTRYSEDKTTFSSRGGKSETSADSPRSLKEQESYYS
jgi:hypothetical protein